MDINRLSPPKALLGSADLIPNKSAITSKSFWFLSFKTSADGTQQYRIRKFGFFCVVFSNTIIPGGVHRRVCGMMETCRSHTPFFANDLNLSSFASMTYILKLSNDFTATLNFLM